MSLKVANISTSDWSNFSHDNANALRSIGVDCVDYKMQSHNFNYASQGRLVPLVRMLKFIEDRDIIQLMHSDVKLYEQVKGLGKKIVVYHTGTPYRINHVEYDKIFSGCDLIITDQCEFLCLNPNMKYLATAINVSKFTPKAGTKTPLEVAHYPSSHTVKGSDEIVRMVRDLHKETPGFSFKYTNKNISHPEQIQRMNECDIYIELFKPLLNGNPYCCYGVTAFEAAALGKVVVTQNLYPDVYKKTYNCNYPFVICNTEAEFKEKISGLLCLGEKEIDLIKLATREWLVDNHSYTATGKILLSWLEQLMN